MHGVTASEEIKDIVKELGNESGEEHDESFVSDVKDMQEKIKAKFDALKEKSMEGLQKPELLSKADYMFKVIMVGKEGRRLVLIT